jgi:RNA polymerase sigma factor (TIGR02999 family)
VPTALPVLLYEELRGLAARYLADERAGHTLQPTALAHEAYLRLAGIEGVEDRVRFMALASVAIRRILVDHARRRLAAKRGGGAQVSMDASDVACEKRGVDVLDFEQALERLALRGERESLIVTLRVYGGMTLDEAAEAVGVSRRTAASDWALARAFLRRELAAYGHGGSS